MAGSGTDESTLLLSFQLKVQEIFSDVDNLSLDSQMWAAYVIEDALVKLFSQIKSRISSNFVEGNVETIENAEEDDSPPVLQDDIESDVPQKSKRAARNVNKPLRLRDADFTSPQDSKKKKKKSGNCPEVDGSQKKKKVGRPRKTAAAIPKEEVIQEESQAAAEESNEPSEEGPIAEDSAPVDETQILDSIKEELLEEPSEDIPDIADPEFSPNKKKGRKRKFCTDDGKLRTLVKVRKPKLKENRGNVLGRPRSSDYVENEFVEVLTEAFEGKCSKCNKEFKSEKNLRNHERCHDEGFLHQCEDCGKMFQTKSGLYAHQRKFHLEDTKILKCSKCIYTTRSMDSLDYHYKKMHDPNRPKNFVCDICGKGFHRSRNLQMHVLGVHTREKSFACDQCDFRTHMEGCLRSHIRNKHTPDRPSYTCKLCGTTLTQQSELKLHMNRHVGLKNFKCPICNKAFSSPSQVAAHKRTHSERTEECQVCHKRFHDKHKLRRHMVVHSGNKHCACPFCPYRCNILDNLRKHCKAVHSQDYPPRTRSRVNERLTHDGHLGPIEVLVDMDDKAKGVVQPQNEDQVLAASSQAFVYSKPIAMINSSGQAEQFATMDLNNYDLIVSSEVTEEVMPVHGPEVVIQVVEEAEARPSG